MTPEILRAGYAARINAAHEAEKARRDDAYINLPFDVCGLKLRAMTLLDYLWLIAEGNAHVTDQVEPEDTLELLKFWELHHGAFLWRLCTSHEPGASAREAFAKRFIDLQFANVAEGIRDYMRETFSDSPVPVGSKKTARQTYDPIRVSFATYWIHDLATAYHWSRAEIHEMPLKEMFLHLRLIRAEQALKKGKRPPALRDDSDRLWAEYLTQLNHMRGAAA